MAKGFGKGVLTGVAATVAAVAGAVYAVKKKVIEPCLLYTSPSPRDS